jgi:hypothetical protein
MSLGQEQEAFSRDLTRLMLHAFSLGYEVRMGEVWRPEEMQKIYVKTGRSKTMKSNHLRKTAADLHFTKNGALLYPEELGKYWVSLHPKNQWGGFYSSFKDKPHFERRP